MKNRYINYKIPKQLIHKILQNNSKEKINFFIDLQSICKGLYKNENIFYEINHYLEKKTPSNVLIKELRNFLNDLYLEFKEYNPFFIIFYDDGINSQNTLLNKNYKDGRPSIKSILMEDDQRALHYHIKSYYFNIIETQFEKPQFGKVYYLKEYESDLIPYYCILNNKFNSNNTRVLNTILSCDKDLLQCCEASNTIQITNRFYSSRSADKKFEINIFDGHNAINYLYDKFKPGILTAKHIPMILAIAGDIADGIYGIKGIGKVGAIKLLQENNIPLSVSELINNKDNLPELLKYDKNFKIILQNLKLIDFREQIKRTSILEHL